MTTLQGGDPCYNNHSDFLERSFSVRKPIIAGNWKMNNLTSDSASLVNALRQNVSDVQDREIVVCPPFTSLDIVIKNAGESNISVGAQNLYFEEKGAYTGEISPAMIKDVGCSHVIIGHSERRQYFGETNQSVNKKIFAALKVNLTPIVCIGETLAEREANKTFDVIGKQIKEGLVKLSKDQMLKLVIAYEPVWAIGTGKTATPEQAEEVHAFIRKELGKMFDKDVAGKTRILYGGSVKPDNIKELMAKENIDGALVGGASLKADSFINIIKY